MKITSIEELYIAELQDLYSAESQISESLPKLIEAVQNEDFKQSLTAHLEETKQQIQRIKQICEEMEIDPEGNECEAAKGLVQEADEIISETDPGMIRDTALTGAAQRVEFYEQAGYETAIRLAESLQYFNHIDLLNESLSEERAAASKVVSAAMAIAGETEPDTMPTHEGRLKVEGKPEGIGGYARPETPDAHAMIAADDEENIYQDEDSVARGGTS